MGDTSDEDMGSLPSQLPSPVSCSPERPPGTPGSPLVGLGVAAEEMAEVAGRVLLATPSGAVPVDDVAMGVPASRAPSLGDEAIRLSSGPASKGRGRGRGRPKGAAVRLSKHSGPPLAASDSSLAIAPIGPVAMVPASGEGLESEGQLWLETEACPQGYRAAAKVPLTMSGWGWRQVASGFGQAPPGGNAIAAAIMNGPARGLGRAGS